LMAFEVLRMVLTELDPKLRTWTAAELRHLPSVERDAILAAAAVRANQDYCLDPELTAFDAFREEDLHGHSSSTQTW
jgi:hypothetical protein